MTDPVGAFMNVSLKNKPHAALVWMALATVYLVWGSTYLAIRVVVDTLPPLLSAGVRFLIAGAIAYGFLWLRHGRDHVRVSGAEVRASAIVGTLLLLGGNGLVSLAERDVPSGLAALIIGAVPLWVILLRAAFGERIGRGTLAAVVVGFAGVALLVLPGNQPAGASLAGVFLLVAAAASWASGSFLSGRLSMPPDVFVSTAVQMLAGGAVLSLAGMLTGEISGLDPSSFSATSLLALGYLVVFGSLVAFTAYVWLLQNAPISKVATYAYVNPVVAIFLGWVLLSEQITSIMLLGASVIIGSVAFTVGRESGAPKREVVEAPAHLATAEIS